jgi:hypothetical protein
MTINQMYRILGKLIEEGHGRKPVAVYKTSFVHNCESDGTVILPVCAINVRWIPTGDDDGGTKSNKDGTESGQVTCVLSGDAADSDGIIPSYRTELIKD